MFDSMLKKHTRMLRHNDIGEFFNTLLADEDNGVFYLDDGYIGFGFLCQPVGSAEDSIVKKLESVSAMDYPPDSFVQVALLGMQDVEEHLNAVKYLRSGRCSANRQDIIHADTESKLEFLRDGSKRPLNKKLGLRVRNFEVMVTVKVPAKKQPPSDKEIEDLVALKNGVDEALDNIGMAPESLTEELYLRKMQTILNWSDDASWRNGKTESRPEMLLRDQVVDPGSGLSVHSEGVSLKDKEVRLLSTHKWPKKMHLSAMMSLVGNWLTGARGIRDNFMIVLNVHVPDQPKARGRLDMKRQAVTYQSVGPMLKFVPRLAEQKEGHDSIYQSLADGGSVVRAYLQFVVFADGKDEADRAVSNMSTYYKECGFQVKQERFFTLPLLLNALPFGADYSAMKQINRYVTMTSKHVCHLMPVLSDWKGSGTPILNLISRTSQQIMGLDVFDSPDNFNMTITAKSGSGKSFLANEIIISYLSSGGWKYGSPGGRVWMIDVGRSYEKLCSALKGQFICFDDHANFSLDPFRLIQDGMEGESGEDGWAEDYELTEEDRKNPGGRDKYFHEQYDSLLILLEAMVSKEGDVTDFQRSFMSRVLMDGWAKFRQELSITKYVEHLKIVMADDPDIQSSERLKAEITKVIYQMYAFTEDGPYGRYFSKRYPPLEFSNDFVVLELEELKGKAHLQITVLLQLLNQIQIEMYLSKGDQRSRRKLVGLDEAWEYISSGEGSVGKWFETGFRRFRKYGGSGLVITQSVNDLYKSPVGQAIVENSSTMMIMAQKPETITQIRKEGRLSLSSVGYDLLETVHTNPSQGYSEIYFYSPMGSGIGRLMVSPFNMLLYSTKAEDTSAIQAYVDQGMGMADAINRVLKDRGEL